MLLWFKYFNLIIDSDKEDEFIKELEELCEMYAGSQYRFGYDVDMEEEDEVSE